MVGAGRAAEGLRADWQRDLALVHRECGFEYVRFHGLLQDELGVYSEDRQGRPIYNFQYIDAIYDAILSAGMRPFVELGFMPQKLASGEKTIFWWKGNVTPPRDYAKWEALIGALVRHWTDRYGREELQRWYFEVWNEPNLKDLFWTGDQAEYSGPRATGAPSLAFWFPGRRLRRSPRLGTRDGRPRRPSSGARFYLACDSTVGAVASWREPRPPDPKLGDFTGESAKRGRK